ncbi:unnamed protein product [[Candida] boidinii]|nr:unnamed protein product [[Candida] boidinii]
MITSGLNNAIHSDNEDNDRSKDTTPTLRSILPMGNTLILNKNKDRDNNNNQIDSGPNNKSSTNDTINSLRMKLQKYKQYSYNDPLGRLENDSSTAFEPISTPAFLSSPYFSLSQISSKRGIPKMMQRSILPNFDGLNVPNKDKDGNIILNDKEFDKIVIPNHPVQTDIITMGLLTYDQAIYLLQHFRDRYGRWVSFPDSYSTAKLMIRIRYKCPLFLTVACTLALKFSDPFLKDNIYKLLIKVIKHDLDSSLLDFPYCNFYGRGGGLEFLQSLIILSIYGLCLSQDDLQIDSWYLSGIAIQLFTTLDSMGVLRVDGYENINNNSDFYITGESSISHSGEIKSTTSKTTINDKNTKLKSKNKKLKKDVTNEFNQLTIYRLWNHLCLVHMIYCILTGRSCINDELRLNLARKTLELSNSTNFDGRMNAELSLHLITYTFLQTNNNKYNGSQHHRHHGNNNDSDSYSETESESESDSDSDDSDFSNDERKRKMKDMGSNRGKHIFNTKDSQHIMGSINTTIKSYKLNSIKESRESNNKKEQESLLIVREELRYWLEQWGYLFDQPANEFAKIFKIFNY